MPELFFAGAEYLWNRLRYSAVDLPYRKIYINPADIRWKLKAEPQTAKGCSVGEVRGGDWDLEIQDVGGPKQESIIEHFVEGVRWQDTVLFRGIYAKLLQSNGEVRGCKRIDELVARYEERYGSLYASMREHGWLPPKLLRADLQPIFVYIGRNGEILWSANGNHRLTIARILKIRQVPVWVRMRHRQWQDFREQVAHSGGRILLQFDDRIRNHPDLRAMRSRSPAIDFRNASVTVALNEKEKVSR